MVELRPIAGAVLRPVLDFALPPRCPGCGAITPDPHRFCVACWQQLRFLGEPCCARCALPFPFPQEEGAECAACLADPPPFDSVAAAVAYGDIPRGVALKLKYGGRPGVAMTMAALMARHLSPGSVLVPVPLHRWRIWSRGYNQAAVIASALSRLAGNPCVPDLLERTRATPPLRRMNPDQRRAALAGSIAVSFRRRAQVQGLSITLVDDVFTSGATARTCAAALRRAGASRIDILCWARVVLDVPEPPVAAAD